MLPNWYTEYKNLIDTTVEQYLTEYFLSEKNPALQTIKEATLYACKGGKRIRSILALEFYSIFSGIEVKNIKKNSYIIKFCIAIELLHAYSLVHDDLPAMDNDELRRGELSVWKKYGETNAILVGDLLNSLSFEILAHIGNIPLIKYFGEAVGYKGMLGGQVLDLYYENNPKELSLEKLIETHNKKTGALIKISIIGGLILANKHRTKKLSKSEIQKYEIFGEQLGLAFQIKDDLLDIEGTIEQTGKSVGEEQKGFVYFLGIKKTKEHLNITLEKAKMHIGNINSIKLDFILKYVKIRKK